MEGCTHLKEFIQAEIDIMTKHIDNHKWFNHIEDLEEATVDFFEKYGWIMQEMYCANICKFKDDCNNETPKNKGK